MKLACSVEVMRHCVDLKAIKSGVENRSIGFQRHSCFEVQARGRKKEGRRKKANAEIACWPQSRKRSKEQSVNIKM